MHDCDILLVKMHFQQEVYILLARRNSAAMFNGLSYLRYCSLLMGFGTFPPKLLVNDALYALVVEKLYHHHIIDM